MKLRAKLIVFGAALSLTLIVCGATLISFANRGGGAATPEYTQTETQKPEQETPAVVAERGYWVCAPGELVMVYDGEDRGLLLESTGITLRSLRLVDQEMLQSGVWLPDETSLRHFLEDFGP